MKQVAKNFLYNSLYQILVMFIPLITAPYLSRVIGAEGVGKYSYAYSVAYYFQIFIKLGLDTYGNRTIALHKETKEDLQSTFWSIYFMQIFCGIIFIALYLAYTVLFAKDTTAAWLLLLFVLSGMFDVNWFFNGLEQFKLTSIRNSLIKISATVCIFAFVKDYTDIYVYIFVMAASFLLSQLVMWPFVFKEVSFEFPKITKILQHFKPNALLFVAILAVSLYRYMDKIMLGSIVNETEVGFYENADKLMQIPISFVNALGVVMLPRMSAIYSRGDDQKKSSNVILLSIIFAMALSSSICFGIMSVSEVLIPIFFGPGFERCIILVKILMLSCLFMCFANVIRTQYIIPKKKDDVFVCTIVLGAVVNIIINTLLIPAFGAAGAAVGTLTAEMTVCLSQVLLVRRELHIKRLALYSFPFIFSGIVMFFSVTAFQRNATLSIALLFEEIGVGAITYILILTLIILPIKEKYIKLIRK